MSAANRDEIVTQFINLTQCPTDEAIRYLEAANWDISIAMDLFFGADNAAPAAPTISRPQVPSSGTADDRSDDEDAFQAVLEESLRTRSNQPQAATGKDSKGGAANKPTEKSRFGTLSNLQKNEESSDEEEGQAFYAGGSDRSGQQIIGPPRGKDNEKKVEKLFEAARKQGAMEADDDHGASSQTRKEKPFTGVGYTLGDDRTPSRTSGQPTGPSAAATAAAAAAAAGRAEQVPLRFFSNGFTVGDGELRSYQENQEFMEHIKRGEVPPELRNLSAGGRQVEVRLEDHRGEEYRPTAPAFKPFGGAGHMLGSPVPTVAGTPSNVKPAMAATTASSASSSASNVDSGRLQTLAQQRLKTSNSSTTIRLRLPDVSAPLNIGIDLTRTLAEVRQFLQDNVPSLQSNQFEFIEPPSIKIKREDEKKTISEAKLTNATLVIRRIS